MDQTNLDETSLDEIDLDEIDHAHARPKTRAECAPGPRPCPWVRCRYHLLVDRIPGILRHGRVHASNSRGRLPGGAVTLTDLDAVADMLLGMRHTCMLDQVVEGGMTLSEVADVIGLSRERIRQLEEEAQAKLGLRVPAP